jgi:hypothetical protein
MHDDELTPAEREALDSLPRERTPSALLQDRVVKTLRTRGFLRPTESRTVVLTGWRLAGAVAASLALLLGGFVLGRWSGGTEQSQPSFPGHGENGLAAALALQHTGAAYVEALEELAASMEADGRPGRAQDGEVALTTLHAAVDRVTRIVPRQQLATQFRLALEAGERAEPPAGADRKTERLAWF